MNKIILFTLIAAVCKICSGSAIPREVPVEVIEDEKLNQIESSSVSENLLQSLEISTESSTNDEKKLDQIESSSTASEGLEISTDSIMHSNLESITSSENLQNSSDSSEEITSSYNDSTPANVFIIVADMEDFFLYDEAQDLSSDEATENKTESMQDNGDMTSSLRTVEELTSDEVTENHQTTSSTSVEELTSEEVTEVDAELIKDVTTERKISPELQRMAMRRTVVMQDMPDDEVLKAVEEFEKTSNDATIDHESSATGVKLSISLLALVFAVILM